jgi:hypothetical protein
LERKLLGSRYKGKGLLFFFARFWAAVLPSLPEMPELLSVLEWV